MDKGNSHFKFYKALLYVPVDCLYLNSTTVFFPFGSEEISGISQRISQGVNVKWFYLPVILYSTALKTPFVYTPSRCKQYSH